jgi:signal transduction histidine kinase
MTPEQQTAEDYRQLQDEYQQLKADYEQLCLMFDNMGQGYEEALNLYDKAVESSRMKTDFIQQISHEIRTPLNILSGFTQILTSGMELDDATKTEVGQGICENTQRITGLVNKMLELAEAGSDAEIERTDDVLAVQIAAQAADESQITMAQHLNFDLQFSPEAEMAMIHTNLQQATRVLVLLLDNAMKFTHPAEAAGGAAAVKEKARVILSVDIIPSSPNPSSSSSPSSSSPSPSPSSPSSSPWSPSSSLSSPSSSPFLSVATSSRQLSFTVEDTGIGIPPDEAEHIFEEFVQLDRYYDGTGIGLTVARSIARRLGGDIVLDTSYSGGARFVYTLPLE